MYKEKPSVYGQVIFWSFVFCALVLLFGCSPYKKLDKRKPKNEKEVTQLAEACVTYFPSKADTITQYKTDTVEVDNTAERVELNAIIDSLLTEKGKMLQDTMLIHQLEERLAEALAETCPPQKVVTKTITNNIIKPDSAKEYLLNKHIKELQVDSTLTHAELTKVTTEKKEIEYKQDHSITYNLEKAAQALLHKWWFWIILAGIGLLLYFRISPFSMIKTPISFIGKLFKKS